MNVNTGATYASLNAAIAAGEKPEDLVEVHGTADQVAQLSDDVAVANKSRSEANRKARNRAANKRARRQRRRNR